MTDLAPADWEADNGPSVEEQVRIDALHSALVAPAHIDALQARIAAFQAEIDAAEAELARVQASVADLPAEVVAEADAEVTPEDVPEAPAEDPSPEAPVEEPAPAPEAEAPVETPADSDAAETVGTGKSTDLNAADAVALVPSYTDAGALKAWVDGDDRKTVQAAADKRLGELAA
jgi:uncharacterized small protein (DUF1192 family)